MHRIESILLEMHFLYLIVKLLAYNFTITVTVKKYIIPR